MNTAILLHRMTSFLSTANHLAPPPDGKQMLSRAFTLPTPTVLLGFVLLIILVSLSITTYNLNLKLGTLSSDHKGLSVEFSRSSPDSTTLLVDFSGLTTNVKCLSAMCQQLHKDYVSTKEDFDHCLSGLSDDFDDLTEMVDLQKIVMMKELGKFSTRLQQQEVFTGRLPALVELGMHKSVAETYGKEDGIEFSQETQDNKVYELEAEHENQNIKLEHCNEYIHHNTYCDEVFEMSAQSDDRLNHSAKMSEGGGNGSDFQSDTFSRTREEIEHWVSSTNTSSEQLDEKYCGSGYPSNAFEIFGEDFEREDVANTGKILLAGRPCEKRRVPTTFEEILGSVATERAEGR